MKINLKEKDMELTVNTYGAYIEKFTKEKKPIFAPCEKTNNNINIRFKCKTKDL